MYNVHSLHASATADNILKVMISEIIVASLCGTGYAKIPAQI